MVRPQRWFRIIDILSAFEGREILGLRQLSLISPQANQARPAVMKYNIGLRRKIPALPKHSRKRADSLRRRALYPRP